MGTPTSNHHTEKNWRENLMLKKTPLSLFLLFHVYLEQQPLASGTTNCYSKFSFLWHVETVTQKCRCAPITALVYTDQEEELQPSPQWTQCLRLVGGSICCTHMAGVRTPAWQTALSVERSPNALRPSGEHFNMPLHDSQEGTHHISWQRTELLLMRTIWGFSGKRTIKIAGKCPLLCVILGIPRRELGLTLY